jgi:hypothetical protein
MSSEKRQLRRIFGPMMKEVVGGWKRWYNKELCNLYTSPNIISDQIKENEIGRSCSTNGNDEKCIQNFGNKTGREETTYKI